MNQENWLCQIWKLHILTHSFLTVPLKSWSEIKTGQSNWLKRTEIMTVLGWKLYFIVFFSICIFFLMTSLIKLFTCTFSFSCWYFSVTMSVSLWDEQYHIFQVRSTSIKLDVKWRCSQSFSMIRGQLWRTWTKNYLHEMLKERSTTIISTCWPQL